MKRVLCFLVILFLVGCGKKAEKPAARTEEKPVESTAVEAANAQKEALPAVTTPAVPSEAAVQPSMAKEPMSALKEASAEKPTPETIQRALKNAKCYQGKIDGSLGPKTKRAIEAFQKQNNLQPDGKVGPKTWERLKTYLTASAEPAAPVSPASPK